MPRPASVARATFSFRSAGDRSDTQTGARQAKKVALAIEVWRIARCQSVMSPPKKRPASQTARTRTRAASGPAGAVRVARAQTNRMGSDKPKRQKALANGPVPACRTNTGDRPMASAPATRRTSAVAAVIATGEAGPADRGRGTMGLPPA